MRTVLILAALSLGSLFVGCKSSQVTQVGPEARRDITYAATAKYPGNPQTSETIRLAAVDDLSQKRLEILNLTDNSVPQSTIWVNGAFVNRVDGIAPRGSTTVRYGELLEAGPSTRDFGQLNQGVQKVEIQSANTLYTVQGPAKK